MRGGILVLLGALGCGAAPPATLSGTPPASEVATPPAPARSQRVRVPLGDRAELVAAGFSAVDGREGTFGGGALTLDATGYIEWSMQRDRATYSPWWNKVDPELGWAVEVRLRVLDPRDQCPIPSVGLWIHDGRRLLKIAIGNDRVGFSYPVPRMVPIASTSDVHTYRVEARGDWARLRVDGQIVIELEGPEVESGGGSQVLMFGDLGGCRGSITEWHELVYDTAPVLDPPPCPSCRPTEARMLARLREALRVEAAGAGTETADERCVARVALDRFTRSVLPRVLEQSNFPASATELRRLGPLSDARALEDASGRVAAAIREVPFRARLRATPKRMVERPPVVQRPQPASWASDTVRAYSLALAGRGEGAVRLLSRVLVEMLLEGYAIRPEVDALVHATMEGARRCPSR
ncbi:MAG: hypothetical protein IT378_06345 [Sandaracinaceae bacterium]|nr:hypothetical protein [Sandaracinaceae bacterium]